MLNYKEWLKSEGLDIKTYREKEKRSKMKRRAKLSQPSQRFRIDQAYGNVYEWDEDTKAYLFRCKLAVFDEGLVESPSTTPAEDTEGW
jgi:hypothetical protein